MHIVQYLLTECSQCMYIVKSLVIRACPWVSFQLLHTLLLFPGFYMHSSLGVDSFRLSYATKLTHF